MAPPIFDADQHHIGLQESGSEYGFLLTGAYSKNIIKDVPPERDEGLKHQITAIQGRSRWTQDDFTGGCFQREWGDDPAMFFRSNNIVPAPQASNLLTFPPVIHHVAKEVEADSFAPNPALPRAMFAISGTLFIVFQHGIYRHVIGSGTFSLLNITAGSSGTNASVRDAMWDYSEETLYALVDDPDEPTYLKRLTSALADAAGTNKHAMPVEAPRNVGRGLCTLGQNIIVGVGQQLWMFEPASKTATGASSVQGLFNQFAYGTAGDAGTASKWTKIGRLPGSWKDAVAYNGLVYILTASEGNATQVFATDGSSILPISDLPFNFVGRCMVQYGGRLFIGGGGLDLNGTDRYAELYEVSGSSVRLVRTFQPDSYVSGESWPETITDLCVADGLLYFSENGVRLWAYDITTDGFFGASDLQPGGGISQSQVDIYKLCVARERLYAWVRSSNASRAGDGIYRIAVGGDTPAAYTASVETSDFCDDIGRKKRWAEVRVLSRYSHCKIEASVDGGSVWFDLTEVEQARSGQAMYVTKADMSGVPFSEQVRLRIKYERGTAVAQFAELIAYTVSFVYEDTQRHAWQFTILNVDEVENYEGNTEVLDNASINSTLWGWFRDKKLLNFRDVDNTVYRVAIADLGESKPIIGSDRHESYLAVTLTEHAVPTT